MTKSATRKELADAAGVSVRTFNRWLKPIMPQLEAMGLRKNDRFIPPAAVKFICQHLSIEIHLNDDS